MAKDYSKRTEEEAKTHQLVRTFLDEKNNWTPKTALVGQVFQAMYHAAMSIEQINRIGAAFNNVDDIDLADAVNTMVKAKVLRTFANRGKRYYEVNY